MKILISGGSGFIGTNLIEFLKYQEIKNIDIKAPKNLEQNKFWVECDILDKAKLLKIFTDFKPEYVIHLAARADVDGKTLDDYKANIEGTENFLEAIKSCDTIKRIVITSTQFVNQYNGTPKHDEDFAPHTIYGESKVLTEKLTRNACLQCCWTIIRPTNIWGPWHWRYPHEFWKVISQGRYFHPINQEVMRSYGYVGNVCWQIMKIIEKDEDLVNRQVFYVGDYSINILNWVNEFSKFQIGKNVRQIDFKYLKVIAIIGDILGNFNVKFPLTSSRLKSMTTSNVAPMKKTYQILGYPPYNLNEAVKETIDWLKKYHPNLIKVKKI